MQIGDKVIAIRTFGEFESSFEGKLISFYNKDSVIVRTRAGHDWVFKTSELRYFDVNNKESWTQ